ncbi:hypothetical protein HID58_067014 [Brassica napus]|uniref:Uncharacterized protein n=1 Tax=Brassica napus TaxID=3708 RepID=A0ABQ7ZHB1_BRANA|nr:hypothetical protein HID58_067014 [Brassica napus]
MEVGLDSFQRQVAERFAFFSGEDSDDVEKEISRQASKTKSVKEVQMDNISGLPNELLVRFQHSLFVLMDFIDKNLPLHRAPVIENLCLSLWESRIAVYRYLRKLDVSYSLVKKENMVPNSLFTCKTLVILKP